jgi:hypothetical protein
MSEKGKFKSNSRNDPFERTKPTKTKDEMDNTNKPEKQQQEKKRKKKKSEGEETQTQVTYFSKFCTVKPVLTTTSEQRPPVYNGQLEHQFSKIFY